MQAKLKIFIAALTLGSCLFAPTTQAATTSINEVVNPGLLTLNSAPAASLSSATLNATSNQTVTGSLGNLSVSDGRGTGAGWAVTASATNFTRVVLARTVGSSGNISVTGAYTSLASGRYTITIAVNGNPGTASFTVSGLESQTATVTGSGSPLGTKGLSLAFDSGAYLTGDQWTVDVSAIPVSDFTITPSAVTALSGVTTGITTGSAYTFTDASDIAPIMTASTGNGLGSYTNNPNLSLTVPSSTRSGNYTATLTETIN